METTTFLIDVTSLLALNALVANNLGWLFTEWKRPLFNFKPFTCRACMAFWFTNLNGALLIWRIANERHQQTDAVVLYLLALAVLLCAFINYLYINSKIKVYE